MYPYDYANFAKVILVEPLSADLWQASQKIWNKKETIVGRLRGVGMSWNSSHHGLVKSNGQSKLLDSNDSL